MGSCRCVRMYIWTLPIITIVNQKGGTGKTTLSANLASAFAANSPVLLLDADAQGSAPGLGRQPVSTAIWNLLQSDRPAAQAPSVVKRNPLTLYRQPPGIAGLTRSLRPDIGELEPGQFSNLQQRCNRVCSTRRTRRTTTSDQKASARRSSSRNVRTASTMQTTGLPSRTPRGTSRTYGYCSCCSTAAAEESSRRMTRREGQNSARSDTGP